MRLLEGQLGTWELSQVIIRNKSDALELPMIKNPSKETMMTLDLEKKLIKLQNLSQNDKEMIEIQRKKLAQQKFEIEKLLK